MDMGGKGDQFFAILCGRFLQTTPFISYLFVSLPDFLSLYGSFSVRMVHGCLCLYCSFLWQIISSKVHFWHTLERNLRKQWRLLRF